MVHTSQCLSAKVLIHLGLRLLLQLLEDVCAYGGGHLFGQLRDEVLHRSKPDEQI